MAERMVGIETEYSYVARDQRGRRRAPEAAVHDMMKLAMCRLPHLPDGHSGGMFLQNGGRFYVDCGLHPELTTPECANPWDVVRYIQAGERMLTGIADELCQREPSIGEAAFFRCNVDYSGARTTWGCHESYLHRAPPEELRRHIIPHLVSRLVYTGAGGFNSLSSGVQFTLSPRVPHLMKEVSNESTHNRGIFHTKDESLSSPGYHRLHVLCGESVCSEVACFLKVGATALVVAMIEAGVRPGDGVPLRSPLEAMCAFAGDVTVTATAELSDKGRPGMTALDIQRHYLGLAEARVDAAFMPPWAGEVCRQWRAMLDRLERGAPQTVATTLDWAIKRVLYEDHARRRGFDEGSVGHWNHIVCQLRDALDKTEYRSKPVTVDLVLRRQSPVADTVQQLTPFLSEQGLSWDGLDPFLKLRNELFEIDTRFGQLGETGIFAQMDRAGALAHHFPGVDNIEHAMTHPPSLGRARLRGECVKRFFTNGNYRCVCDWQGIWDHQSGRALGLSDPWETQERWQDWRK